VTLEWGGYTAEEVNVILVSRWRLLGAVVLTGGLVALSACGDPQPHTPPIAARPVPAPSSPRVSSRPAASPDRPDHVVVVIFENKSYDHIAGRRRAPYLNGLMAESANFTDAHAETHPSQPNYLAFFSGSVQGVTDDSCLNPMHGRPNLASQLIAAGYTFTGYSEDLPRPGYRGCSSGLYAAKHNPWVYFTNVPATANQPYSAMPTDLDRLPTVAFVIPNLCNDMHDCSIATGDRWSKTHVEPYLRWATTHNSRLILTFDENDGAPGNHIVTLIAGAGITPGPRSEPINHYSVLRTIEDWYGLSPLGGAGNATPIHDLG
jgi:hypothetical protein